MVLRQIDAHVASWTSAFLAQAETMVETRFYRGVLKLTGAFLDEEPAAMGETEEAIA